MAEKSGADLPEQWTHTPRKVLRFQPGSRIADLDTDTSPGFDGSRQDAEAVLADRSERFAGLQEMLYANGKAATAGSVLLVLQGMDTAGKGGIVEHVIGAGSPMGIRYTGFGKPTDMNAHHYLWRINKALPPAGHIGVFDRSHYEDVLVVRVHNLVPPAEWEQRYDEINAFESELVDSGMTLVKVAMFVSLDEQKKRAWPNGWSGPTSTGSTTPAISTSASSKPAYQEAYQAVLDRTPPNTRRGTYCRATRSGTPDWP